MAFSSNVTLISNIDAIHFCGPDVPILSKQLSSSTDMVHFLCSNFFKSQSVGIHIYRPSFPALKSREMHPPHPPMTNAYVYG